MSTPRTNSIERSAVKRPPSGVSALCRGKRKDGSDCGTAAGANGFCYNHRRQA